MFENIIGYDHIISHWVRYVHNGTVPSGILISGRPLSGKSSFALELSRVLLCKEKGDWNCTCPECKSCKILTNDNVIMLGQRNFMAEIHCGIDMVSRESIPRASMFFRRAVSKLLRRADAFLWEHAESTARSVREPAEKLSELLTEYQANDNLWYSTKHMQSIATTAEKLQRAFPERLLHVQLLRNMMSWARITSHGLAKIVIIERSQDMLPQSENMLLKILEEPPHDVYFILTTNNKNSILPTIRSRLRAIDLPKRSLSHENTVLKKVFGVTPPDTGTMNIQEFLYSFAYGTHTADIHDRADDYYHAVIELRAFDASLLSFLDKTDQKSKTLFFLTCLQNKFKETLFQQNDIVFTLQNIWKDLCDAVYRVQKINISPKLVLETLYYNTIINYEGFLTDNTPKTV